MEVLHLPALDICLRALHQRHDMEQKGHREVLRQRHHPGLQTGASPG